MNYLRLHKLFFRAWFLCFALLISHFDLAAKAAETGAEFALGEGEIRFDGHITAVDAAQSQFTLAVSSFTNPNGRSGKVEPPKMRPVTVNAATLLEVRGTEQKLTLAQLQDSEIRVYAIVIGRDGGAGQPFNARQIAAWNLVKDGQYLLKTKTEATPTPPAIPPVTPPVTAPATPVTPVTPPPVTTPTPPVAPQNIALPAVIGGTKHSGPIWGVAYSPDGKLIATVGSEVRPFQAENLLTAENNPFLIKSPRANINHELAGSEVKLWDATTGELRASWPLVADASSLNVMRAVSSLITNQAANPAQQVHTMTAMQLLGLAQPLILKGIGGTIWPLAFSPDGSLVVAGSLDGTARLWSAKTGKLVAVLANHGGLVSSVAFTPDSKQVITTKGTPFSLSDTANQIRANAEGMPKQGEIRFWDARSGELLRTIETGAYTGVGALAVSPDGALLVANVFSHPGLSVMAKKPPPARATDGVDFQIYDVPTGRLVRTINSQYAPHRLLFTPDAKTLIGANLSSLIGEEGRNGNQDVRLWDVATGQTKTFVGLFDATDVAISPDGQTVAACRGSWQKWNGQLVLWNATSGQIIRDTAFGYPLLGVAFSPDGKTLALSGGPIPGTVNQWNIATGQPLPWHATAAQ